MFTITLNFSDLSEKMEQYLEKEFAYLEKITGKPREFLFQEALVRYMEGLEWELEKRKLKEEKKRYPTPEELETLWNRLRNISPEYYFKEALISYVEDMEDIRDVEKYEKRKKNGKVKYYTSEEADERLKELRAKNA